MTCPECNREVAPAPDGAVGMHAGPGGGLCKGTNCRLLPFQAVALGGITLPIVKAWHDPDGNLVTPLLFRRKPGNL